jgi:hypothetical protein
LESILLGGNELPLQLLAVVFGLLLLLLLFSLAVTASSSSSSEGQVHLVMSGNEGVQSSPSVRRIASVAWYMGEKSKFEHAAAAHIVSLKLRLSSA